jgi:hypothetical protein
VTPRRPSRRQRQALTSPEALEHLCGMRRWNSAAGEIVIEPFDKLPKRTLENVEDEAQRPAAFHR